MRSTFDLDSDLLKEVMKKSGAKTKKGAIVIALTEYLKAKRREELKEMIGNYDGFGLSLKDLEKMRRDRK